MSILTIYDSLAGEFRQYTAYLEEQGIKALLIHGHFDTLDALTSAVPRPQGGDAYTIGTELPYDVYIYDGVHGTWQNNGPLSEKGDPFTYDDFTPEQLAALTPTIDTSAFTEYIDEHNESSVAHSTLLNTLLSDKADLISGKVKAEQASSDVVTVTADATLTASHAGKCLVCANSSAVTITIPPDVLTVGTELEVVQYGEGSVTFAAGDGVTIYSKDSALTIGGQYTVAVLKQIVANTWLLTGSLEI